MRVAICLLVLLAVSAFSVEANNGMNQGQKSGFANGLPKGGASGLIAQLETTTPDFVTSPPQNDEVTQA